MPAVKYCAEVLNQHIFQAVLSKWNSILEILSILEVPYVTTQALQNPKFVLSDFYKCWIKIQLNLKEMVDRQEKQTDFAEILLKCIDSRKNLMMNHPAMKSAMFLDPRFYYDMNQQEKSFARIMLIDVWKRVKRFHQKEQFDQLENDGDQVELYFVSKGQPRVQRVHNDTHDSKYDLSEEDFKCMLENYEKDLPRIHHSVSMLDYWSCRLKESDHIKNFTQLQIVAAIIFGISPTQVPCERSFSHVNFVFGCKRYQIQPETLEAILMVRLNRELFYMVKNEDLLKLNT